MCRYALIFKRGVYFWIYNVPPTNAIKIWLCLFLPISKQLITFLVWKLYCKQPPLLEKQCLVLADLKLDSHNVLIPYTRVNKRNSLLSTYCILRACFFPGFTPTISTNWLFIYTLAVLIKARTNVCQGIRAHTLWGVHGKHQVNTENLHQRV